MLRKGLAGLLGVVVALGGYALIGLLTPGPARLEQATSIQDSAVRLPVAKMPIVDPTPVRLPAPKIRVVDPTPVRLVIAAINVDATIEARGLDTNRNLATPSDFRDVAWYNLGPKPGDPGNAVMNGHVNWWTGDAVFTHLSQLRTGDEVRVVRADGGVVVFTVTGEQIVDAKARVASLFASGTQPTLTLITCSGVWNPLVQSDTQRLLVSAALA